LFAFGACLWGSFTIGSNDTAPEIVAIVLYGLSILPACILAIWFQKGAALWLIALFPITLYGSVYQMVKGPAVGDYKSLAREVMYILIISAIPGLLGFLLLRSARDEREARTED